LCVIKKDKRFQTVIVARVQKTCWSRIICRRSKFTKTNNVQKRNIIKKMHTFMYHIRYFLKFKNCLLLKPTALFLFNTLFNNMNVIWRKRRKSKNIFPKLCPWDNKAFFWNNDSNFSFTKSVIRVFQKSHIVCSYRIV